MTRVSAMHLCFEEITSDMGKGTILPLESLPNYVLIFYTCVTRLPWWLRDKRICLPMQKTLET